MTAKLGTGRLTPREQPPSALDAFLREFLVAVAGTSGGYRPVADGPRVAAEHGWPDAFSQALFDSAQGRKLIEPFNPRPNLTRWRVSRRGREWIAAPPTEAVPLPGSPSEVPLADPSLTEA